MVLGLPKNPKIEDVVGALGLFDQRISAVETQVEANAARIAALEGRQAADTQTLRARADRERWLGNLKRRR